MLFYSRDGKDFIPEPIQVLYWTATGIIISWGIVLRLASGENAEIKSGRWSFVKVTPTAEMMAELSAGNVKVDRGQLVLAGERKYSETKPTAIALEPR